MMTNKEEANLLLALQAYKGIEVSYALYDFLFNKENYYRLKLDFWCNKEHCLFNRVSYTLQDALSIRVRDIGFDNMAINNNVGWSPLIELKDFDRIIKLKEFW